MLNGMSNRKRECNLGSICLFFHWILSPWAIFLEPYTVRCRLLHFLGCHTFWVGMQGQSLTVYSRQFVCLYSISKGHCLVLCLCVWHYFCGNVRYRYKGTWIRTWPARLRDSHSQWHKLPVWYPLTVSRSTRNDHFRKSQSILTFINFPVSLNSLFLAWPVCK